MGAPTWAKRAIAAADAEAEKIAAKEEAVAKQREEWAKKAETDAMRLLANFLEIDVVEIMDHNEGVKRLLDTHNSVVKSVIIQYRGLQWRLTNARPYSGGIAGLSVMPIMSKTVAWTNISTLPKLGAALKEWGMFSPRSLA